MVWEINRAYNNGFVGRAKLQNAWSDFQLDTCSLDDAQLEHLQTDVDRALELNPNDANAHRQAALLAIHRARNQFCSQPAADRELIDQALNHAQSAIEHRPNYAHHLRGRAEVIRWALQVGEFSQEERRDLAATAFDHLEKARAVTDFDTRCDLEEAELLSVVYEDADNLERARTLAQKIADEDHAFALQAQRLVSKLELKLGDKPGGS